MKAVSEAVSTPVIASSGCGSPQHMLDVFEAGADAALAASIFHFDEYSIQETKAYLDDHDVPVRLD
jgi:cyclase